MKQQLIKKFNEYLKFTPNDKEHAAAVAIHEVIFKSDPKKWNAEQDAKWTKKYNKGLLILAEAGLIVLTCRK